MKTKRMFALGLLLAYAGITRSQCTTLPVFAATLGTEPEITSNEVVITTQTRWFYHTGTVNDAVLRGGTLIVKGDLTLNNFNFERGTMVIEAGGRVVVNNGAGMVLRGDCAIYNWGFFQSSGNIVLDNGITSALQPNIVVNATATASFQMATQYLVINNPWSKFVNNGNASFGGIITETNAANSCVCLGNGSTTATRLLINNARHTYAVSSGNACLNVTVWSQFRNDLTNTPALLVCLAAAHTSDATCIPFGCRPNAWGAATVGTNCVSCTALRSTLPTQKFEASVLAKANGNWLSWAFNATQLPDYFLVQRAIEGLPFHTIDSIPAYAPHQSLDAGSNSAAVVQYRVLARYQNGARFYSNLVQVKRNQGQPGIYPNPFTQSLTIKANRSLTQASLQMLDATGRVINSYRISKQGNLMHVRTTGLPPGIYTVIINNEGKTNQYKVLKQ